MLGIMRVCILYILVIDIVLLHVRALLAVRLNGLRLYCTHLSIIVPKVETGKWPVVPKVELGGKKKHGSDEN